MKWLICSLVALAGPVAWAQTDPLVARGDYLARASDCISCHTAPGGKPFAGGLAMNTPLGTIWSTNITPDADTGIGHYTQAEFARALRQGRARDDHYLYPAMPYANFALLADDDVAALYAYFTKGVAPVRQANRATELTWPFSMRPLMAGWNLLYLPRQPYKVDAAQSPAWNRGAYLVQGAGHCGACHTPRGWAQAEKAANDKAGPQFLSGAVIDGWFAQPLRNTALPGLATWSNAEVVEYLKAGRTDRTAAFGAMAQVVQNSTQHLREDDLLAIATYVKSLEGGDSAPVSGAAPGAATTQAAPAPSSPAATADATALRNGQVQRAGALVYLNNCSACHRSDGQGARRSFPALARNSVVAAPDATSLIRMVLQGGSRPATQQSPAALGMPGFGWRLTDQNVADLLTFVRASWGNAAAAVSPGDVAKVRDSLKKAGGS